MADGTVICSIERLFDWEPTKEAVIGVTISAAWGNSSKAPPANFLLPWNWLSWNQGPENLKFYWACCVPSEPNVKPKFAAQTILPQGLTYNTKTVGSIRDNGKYRDFAENSIQPRYDQIRKNLANLGYPKGGQNTVTVSASASDGPGDSTAYGSGAVWPSILADLSTRPAPIPHALLLSFIFQLGKIGDLLPNRDDGTTPTPEDCCLLVAPVLPAKATGKATMISPVIDPAATPLGAGGDSASQLWNYSDNGYQASSQMVALGAAPPRKSFFDLASRLVKAPGNEQWHFNEDWQSSFESRLGERLDLSAELANILAKESFDDTTARSVIDAAIAALRDITGIGLDPAPCGVSFLQASGVDPALIKTIQSVLPGNANFNNVAGWKAFLQKALATTETTLSDLYLAGLGLWNSAPITSADAVQQFNRVRQKLLAPAALWALLQLQISSLVPAAVVTQPSNLDIFPSTLRVENLGRYWGRKGLLAALDLGASPYSAAKIREALQKQLQAMAVARFQDARFLPAVSPAIAAAAKKALSTQTSAADWADAADYAIPNAASATSTDPGQRTASLASQGITVQINELGDTGHLSGNEAAPVRKFQGAVLLLGLDTVQPGGKTSTSGYKCLNYADVCYSEASGGKSSSQILEHSVLVPLRFTWHSDVALATVCYNNEALPASGPLSRAAKLVSPGGGDSTVAVGTDLLWYSYPTTEKPDPQKHDPKTAVTALTFGRDYHPQPLLVSNAGAVPKSMATDYLDLKVGDDLDQAKNIGETWATIRYRRQNTPGALRLSNADTGPIKHLKLPAIPDGVFPRAGAVAKDQPVVMLVPEQSRFTRDLPQTFQMKIRPPATDLLTWDRFVNGFGNALAQEREAVFKEFLTEIRRQKADITIDDPATVYAGYDCKLYFELLNEDGVRVKADFISFPQPTGSGLRSVQAGALSFNFVAEQDSSKVKSKPPTIEVVSANVTVAVYEGRTARLRLHTCVHQDYAGRFERDLLTKTATLQGTYYLLPPTEIVIEVVTDALPGSNDLFDQNTFQVGAFNGLDGTAQISLNLAGVPNQQYVYSAEVLRQVWKWQGRPVLPLPRSGDVTAEWLTREFGTRLDTDLLRASMLPPAGNSRTFVFTEQRGSLLSDTERASSSLRQAVSSVAVPAESRLLGTYIRYGVQVESRYKPLLRHNGYVRGAAGDGSLWRNLYIPSRKLAQIKPPDVKLILPLTRNASDPESGPGILVMLRGPWFRECGLGERLEARITMVETPDENPANTPRKKMYYQYGSDPILSHPAKLDAVFEDLAETGWGKDETATIQGPVGHTFDTVSSGQLFLNTSFALKYPAVAKLNWSPWAFCKVQVRKVVDVIGVPSPAAVSDWSFPTWVQLLPDFDRYSTDGHFVDLALSYQSDSKTFNLVNDKDGNPVKLTAGNGDNIYANYLAVTHFISDAGGAPIQEAYDGLYRQSGKDWVSIGSSPASPSDVQSYFRARVLTVQGQKPSVTDEDVFWDNIFAIEKKPGDPSGDLVQDVDRLRIVGVSRPIDVPNSPFRGC